MNYTTENELEEQAESVMNDVIWSTNPITLVVLHLRFTKGLTWVEIARRLELGSKQAPVRRFARFRSKVKNTFYKETGIEMTEILFFNTFKQHI